MANFLANATRLVSTPEMFSVYYDWFATKLFSSDQPSIKCTDDTRISGFSSFSEYWSFHKGIPESELHLIRNCLKHAPEDFLAIDIGANIGLFTVALASLGCSKVHSFEPVPSTFAVLESNVRNNNLTKGICLNCLAVGDKQGTVEFEVFDKSPAINRIASAENGKNANKQIVPVTTLDEFCLDHKIEKIDFLKIDVEGMETLVIKGAQKILQNRLVSIILIEICPANLNLAGFSVSELYSMILEVGYRPHRLTVSGEVGESLDLVDLDSIRLENVVLAPK